ncbi:MAG: glycosyltransferase 87 family protein [Micropruina sp.]
MLTRAALLLHAALVVNDHDVGYYWRELAAAPGAGVLGTFPEYPTPVLGLFSALAGLSGGSYGVFRAWVVALNLSLDLAAVLILLRSREASAGHRPALFWTVMVAAVGSVVYHRFDLIPAVAVVLALVMLGRRPALAGLALAVGTAFKMWPAILVPFLLGRRTDRSRVWLGFVGAGAGLALVSVWGAGWARLISPLGFQSVRGLQFESVLATPLMLARAFGAPIPGGYELQGALAAAALAAGTVIGWLAYLVMAALAWRLLRSGVAPSADQVALAVSAAVAVLQVTNKVLSPQYLVWLAAPLALCFTPQSDAQRSRWLAGLALVTAALTNVMFPHFYEVYVGGQPGVLLGFATGILVLRNLLLVWLTVQLLRMAWSGTSTRRLSQ